MPSLDFRNGTATKFVVQGCQSFMILNFNVLAGNSKGIKLMDRQISKSNLGWVRVITNRWDTDIDNRHAMKARFLGDI